MLACASLGKKPVPKLDLEGIQNAQHTLQDIVWETPFELSHTLSDTTGGSVYLKAENLQRTGSFKIRGAYYKIQALTPEEKAGGIVTASAGNHAQGVGLAATNLSIPCRIFVPETVPSNKLEAIRRYPVEIVQTGRLFDAAQQAARKDASNSGRVFVSPFDDPMIMAGHGTIALEMLSAVPDLKAVLIPVGGGGLIAGMATAFKALDPTIAIIGCQSSASCAMARSLEEDRPYVNYPSLPTIAEGLEGGISQATFQLGRRLIDHMVVVEEDEIRSAIRFLLQHHHLVVEGSGAVGVAALLYGRWATPPGNIGVVLTGGNMDYQLLKQIVNESEDP